MLKYNNAIQFIALKLIKQKLDLTELFIKFLIFSINFYQEKNKELLSPTGDASKRLDFLVFINLEK